MKDPLSREYYATILQGTDKTSLRIEDVETAVRLGQMSQDTLILYYPWTGTEYLPIWNIPELKDATESKMARLMDYVREQVFPWTSFILFLLLVLAGILQYKGWLGTDTLLQYSLGWGNTIIAGRWWTVLTYILVHNSLGHWLGNSVLFLFCSIRVERIFGWTGLLWGGFFSVSLASVIVILFESSIVVGASVLVFGLWAMQVMAGFRFIHNLPTEMQRHYGWSSFISFAPIVIFNTMALGISQGAHWGALLGGGLMGMLYKTPKMFAKKSILEIRSLLRLFVVGLLCALSIPLLSKPQIWKLFDEHMILDEGIDLSISSKMLHVSNCDIQMWRVNDTSQFQIFAHVGWLSKGQSISKTQLQKWWLDCGVELFPLEEYDRTFLSGSKVEYADAVAQEWFWQDASKRVVWEQVIQEGQRIVHVGCMLEDRRQSWQYCQHWLSHVQISEGIDLVEKRAAWLQHRSEIVGIEYAQLLEAYGDTGTAQQVLHEVVEQRGAEQKNALSQYLSLLTWEPDDKVRVDWMMPTLLNISLNDFALLEQGVDILIRQKKCDYVHQILEKWDSQLPNSTEHLHLLWQSCVQQ